jgi:TatD DNase family protein
VSTNIRLIDTHCHLYSGDLVQTIHEVVQRAAYSGVSDMYMPNVDGESIHHMLDIEARFGQCHAMMGLHPCSVDTGYSERIALVESWFDKRSFAGVGECGIDLFWDKTFIDEQRAAFDAQIMMGAALNIPIIIHSREAQDITIDMIAARQDGRLSGVFHCFTGTVEEVKKIKDLGFMIGIGGVVTYKNSNLGEVLREVGLDNVVLETDSPYLAPVPKRGKENEPSYIAYVANKIAEVMDMDIAEVATITTANAEKLFMI